MRTVQVIQNCGCVINIYPDGSAGGAEIGEWCALHGSAQDMCTALRQIAKVNCYRNPATPWSDMAQDAMKIAKDTLAELGETPDETTKALRFEGVWPK